MPLTDFGQQPIVSTNAVHWQMVGDQPVAVSVGIDLLERVEPGRGGTSAVDKFGEFRKAFCRIASGKFDAGETEEDGSVAISAPDIQRYS